MTAVSAVGFGLVFPPLSWKPLAWVTLAPFFLALRSAGRLRALLLALLWTGMASYLVADWLPRAVSTYFQQPRIVGALFFVFVVATMAAPYYMAFGAAYRPLVRRFGPASPLLVAAAWVALELGRGRLFNGTLLYFGSTPWATLGYSQAGIGPLVQIASVTGVYGVSFVLVAVNAGLVELFVAVRERRARRETALCLALAALPALAALAFGAGSLLSAPARTPDLANTEVAIVQGNLGLRSRWRPEYYARNLDTYLRLTLEGFRQGQPETVFWPEAAMTFFVEEEPLYRRAIARVLASGGAELVGGAPHADGAARPVYRNSIFLLAEDGATRARYDKRHLVPFMEYFPLGIDLLRRSFGRIREFSPGEATSPLPTRAGRAGVLLCNEAMLPHFAAQRVADGAEYLANPSNDSWATGAKYALQQFDIVAFRAIEQRRYLVRASTTGPSAIVDPWGRAQARIESFTSGVRVGRIRALRGRSVYGRLGDLFGFGCASSVAAALLVAARRRRES